MSIAEKLTTIATNQQLVYNAGYTAGQAAGGGGGGGGGEPTPTQEKTVDVTENGTVVVTPDEGYALSKVTANVDVIPVDTATKYAIQLNRMFYNANFPDGYELVVDAYGTTNLAEMFRAAIGLKKLTLRAPVTTAFSANYFCYTTASRPSSLVELVLPDGIKFASFSNFAVRASVLKTISGTIDLSESTANDACFSTCPALEEVRFAEGSITKSLTFNQSESLSDASIASIIGGLAAVTDQQILTLHSTVVNKLNPEQLKTAFNKNWDIE